MQILFSIGGRSGHARAWAATRSPACQRESQPFPAATKSAVSGCAGKLPGGRKGSGLRFGRIGAGLLTNALHQGRGFVKGERSRRTRMGVSSQKVTRRAAKQQAEQAGKRKTGDSGVHVTRVSKRRASAARWTQTQIGVLARPSAGAKREVFRQRASPAARSTAGCRYQVLGNASSKPNSRKVSSPSHNKRGWERNRTKDQIGRRSNAPTQIQNTASLNHSGAGIASRACSGTTRNPTGRARARPSKV